eukprot:TRINITY_DN4011_c0_g1_i1.p1 TRINITY_DN4011_c0_g1~~TRINITY_DN4011_c0_g1_i1.p1  ORF type:complete len:103 (-),score=29.98 TRINITY_DN4011_c0_g1_i1:229-537(-)
MYSALIPEYMGQQSVPTSVLSTTCGVVADNAKVVPKHNKMQHPSLVARVRTFMFKVRHHLGTRGVVSRRHEQATDNVEAQPQRLRKDSVRNVYFKNCVVMTE